MSGYMQVTAYGRVGRKPDLKYSKGDGEAFATFSMAVDRPGQRNETDWLDVVCFKKTAELVAESVEKGDRLLVVGRPEAVCFEGKDGWRATLKVVADRVTFIESKRERGDGGARPSTPAATTSSSPAPNPNPDELPF